MKRAVILFTRAPVPGQTKTRMMPYLSGEDCAAMHRAFLTDIAVACRKTDADVFVFATPPGPETEAMLRPLFGEDVPILPQTEGDLGERMYRAIQQVLEMGYDACVLTGTDIPMLSARVYEHAFAALEQADLVFGPSEDGGYYLVGMKQPCPEAFRIHSYGHDKVLDDTLEGLENAGLSVKLTDTLFDVDTRENFLHYWDRIRREPALERTASGRFLLSHLRLSIIVITYNEAETVDCMLRQLAPYRSAAQETPEGGEEEAAPRRVPAAAASRTEVLFVDGGSTDGTAEKIEESGFRLLRSPKGRGRQLNLGAEKSDGDILFFVHCDSVLPQDFEARIQKVMARSRCGYFGVRFPSRNFFMWTNRVISNARAKYGHIVFGDQGIFLDRRLFFEIGEYPEYPLMEDYQFSMTLRDAGYRPVPAGETILTSGRRYQGGTVKKLLRMKQMYDLRKRYLRGEDPESLFRDYEDEDWEQNVLGNGTRKTGAGEADADRKEEPEHE